MVWLLDYNIQSNWISLNETQYCFVDNCTIRVKDSNIVLNIVNKTEDWIIFTNTTKLFIAPANGMFCSLEILEDPAAEVSFFITCAIIVFFATATSCTNIVLHLVIKEMRSTAGILIIKICIVVNILALCGVIAVIFQYLYRFNGNSTVCAVLRYFIKSFVLITIIIKATYLFHFAYLMYRTYKRHSQSEEKDKWFLCIYGLIIITVGMVCSALVIVVDLLKGRSAFDTYNGYCAEFFSSDTTISRIIYVVLIIIGATCS